MASHTSSTRLYSSRDRIPHKSSQTLHQEGSDHTQVSPDFTAAGIASHTSSARLYSSRDRVTHKWRQTLQQQGSHHKQVAPDFTPAGITSHTSRASSQASNQRLGFTPKFTAAQYRLYSSRHHIKNKCRQTLQQEGSRQTQKPPDRYSRRDCVTHK